MGICSVFPVTDMWYIPIMRAAINIEILSAAACSETPASMTMDPMKTPARRPSESDRNGARGDAYDGSIKKCDCASFHTHNQASDTLSSVDQP